MKKVFIGMSGGVDSSVSALLLLKAGYEVVGVNFKLRDNDNYSDDAQQICDYLKIDLHKVDFSKIFNEKVFQPFVQAYKSGKTPNLCVLCNKFIKFGAFYDYAMSNGGNFMATGHYCANEVADKGCNLLRAIDEQKDQTYFLNQVSEKALSKTIFPLSKLVKSQVREIAEREGLITAHKKGSSDICIMGNKSFREFISEYIPPKDGKIIACDGKCVGNHCGVFGYTLGQRKGLGVGGVDGGDGRWFVTKKDVTKNIVFVSHNENDLLATSLVASNCNFIGFTPTSEFECLVKTRYRQELQKVKVFFNSGSALVKFEFPQRALTVGQYCVFYDNSKCLGGGEIIEVI